MSDALQELDDTNEVLRVTSDYHSLDHVQLERFLERRRANPTHLELSLADNLIEVLRRANGFVPSAAGSILLDNPSEKQEDRRQEPPDLHRRLRRQVGRPGRPDHPGGPGDRRPGLPDRRDLRHLRTRRPTASSTAGWTSRRGTRPTR